MAEILGTDLFLVLLKPVCHSTAASHRCRRLERHVRFYCIGQIGLNFLALLSKKKNVIRRAGVLSSEPKSAAPCHRKNTHISTSTTMATTEEPQYDLAAGGQQLQGAEDMEVSFINRSVSQSRSNSAS
jgi:hypothetical protein